MSDPRRGRISSAARGELHVYMAFSFGLCCMVCTCITCPCLLGHDLHAWGACVCIACTLTGAQLHWASRCVERVPVAAMMDQLLSMQDKDMGDGPASHHLNEGANATTMPCMLLWGLPPCNRHARFLGPAAMQISMPAALMPGSAGAAAGAASQMDLSLERTLVASEGTSHVHAFFDTAEVGALGEDNTYERHVGYGAIGPVPMFQR